MPVYEHLCEKGHKFDRYLKLAELDQPQTCECGGAAKRIISPVMFSIDATNFPSYQSPTTGRWITSKTQRREDMKASNCVDYEPSLRMSKPSVSPEKTPSLRRKWTNTLKRRFTRCQRQKERNWPQKLSILTLP